MKDFKQQIMHTDKELSVDYFLNNLTQLNNESKAQGTQDQQQSQTKVALTNTKPPPAQNS